VPDPLEPTSTATTRERCQFFLPDIVRQPTSVDSDAATEHQCVNACSIHQVGVIPVINPGSDEDRAFSVGMLSRRAPFPGKSNQHITPDARVLFTPRWSVGRFGIVIVGGIITRQPAMDSILSHQQVVRRRDVDFGTICSLQSLDGHATVACLTGPKVVQLDSNNSIVLIEKTELRMDVTPVLAVLEQ